MAVHRPAVRSALDDSCCFLDRQDWLFTITWSGFCLQKQQDGVLGRFLPWAMPTAIGVLQTWGMTCCFGSPLEAPIGPF